MTKTEYMKIKKLEAKRKQLRKQKLQAGAVFAGLLLLAGIVGKVDCDVYNGIHTTTGTVVESVVKASNGNTYRTPNFQNGSEVKIKLDGNGNVLSIISK